MKKVETLDEFLHRITIEQQDARRADTPRTKRVKCAPAQDAREQVYIQMRG